MELLNTLNEAQKNSVEYNSGHHMIVAGAGSGKTRVLTHKIAYLLETGEYEPENLLALTFTNKAAKEMKERVEQLIGEKAKKLWIGSFHSVFARILRVESSKLDYEPNFAIYDREDSVALVGTVIDELNYSFDNMNNSAIQHKISNLKNKMILPAEYAKDFADNSIDKKFAEVYRVYTERLKANNSMDFDDLLLKPIELFINFPRILQKYRKQFKYLLVDEYQDTNKPQNELLKHLTTGKSVLCVVGDDAQSIYGWRGAEISNMLEFEKEFENAKIFKLEQNYRSTQKILDASGSVIKNNGSQIEKSLWTENNEGENLTVIKCADEKDEALQISKLIKKEIAAKKLSYNNIAILYRINSQSRSLEDGLRKNKIPYDIISGLEFYRRKEVKDIVAYLRILANQNDEESLLRIMNFPQRGIGNTSIEKMLKFARKLNITLFTTMSRVFEVIEVKERIQKNVKGFKQLLDKYIDIKNKNELSIYELTSALVDELGILKLYKEDGTAEAKARYDNVQELLSAISDFSKTEPEASLDKFLAEVSLISGIDQNDDSDNKVKMMTMHSAKGLEYPVVFVTGCEEDIFPLASKFDEDASDEEERRLFYVAVTRAEQKVYITYARSRYRFGEVAYQSRSRFIDELDTSTYTEVNGGVGRKSNRRKKVEHDEMYQESYDDFDQERKSLRVGSRVTHDNFGNGKVVQITGAGDMQKVSVNFEGIGNKTLLLKFANLKII